MMSYKVYADRKFYSVKLYKTQVCLLMSRQVRLKLE